MLKNGIVLLNLEVIKFGTAIQVMLGSVFSSYLRDRIMLAWYKNKLDYVRKYEIKFYNIKKL